MKSIYLHIGFPKTGTTFLQKEVFLKCTDHGYSYLNKDFGNVDYFNVFKKKNRGKIILLLNKTNQLLISDETYILSTIGESVKFKDFKGYLELFDLVNYLKEKNINLKLFLNTRNQADLLCSLYVQLQRGHLPKKYDFFDFIKHFNPNNSVHKLLCFKDIEKELLKYLDNDNIFIDSYEAFKLKPNKFIKHLLSNLSLPEDLINKINLSKQINSRSISKKAKINHPLTLRFILYRLKNKLFGSDFSFGIGTKIKPFLDLIVFKKPQITVLKNEDIKMINNWYGD